MLPLKEDHEESTAVYGCICNLVLSSNSHVNFLQFWATDPFNLIVVSCFVFCQQFSLFTFQWYCFYLYLQILSFAPQLVSIFAQVAESPVESDEVKFHIGRAFSHLISIYGHQIQPVLGNLSPAQANALAAIAPKSWDMLPAGVVFYSELLSTPVSFHSWCHYHNGDILYLKSRYVIIHYWKKEYNDSQSKSSVII